MSMKQPVATRILRKSSNRKLVDVPGPVENLENYVKDDWRLDNNNGLSYTDMLQAIIESVPGYAGIGGLKQLEQRLDLIN